MIVGFSGYGSSGKDTAAEALVELGFTHLAFADVLRDVLLALNPIVGTYGRVMVRLSDVIAKEGWDGYKTGPFKTEVTALLQKLGTEGGRELINENVWVNSTLDDLDPHGKYVVSDVRFPNECDAIRSKYGEIWRIEKPGVGPKNNHKSETALDAYAFDGTFVNDGSKEEFVNKIKEHFSIAVEKDPTPPPSYVSDPVEPPAETTEEKETAWKRMFKPLD